MAMRLRSKRYRHARRLKEEIVSATSTWLSIQILVGREIKLRWLAHDPSWWPHIWTLWAATLLVVVDVDGRIRLPTVIASAIRCSALGHVHLVERVALITRAQESG